MHRKFIAAIAAASIFITGISAAPVRAGDDDVARALAAIVGLAIVGAAINEARDDRKKKASVTRKKVHKHHQVKKPHHIHPRPLPHRARRNLLPGECLYSFDTYEGPARVFGARCLERNYRYVNSLPQSCLRRVWTDRGTRYGYGARCLRRQGYQLAHR